MEERVTGLRGRDDTADGPAPEVTVVVPARDEEASLGPCLEALLGQTFGDIEVLVVDGASTDDTGAVAERYRRNDGRVRVLHNPDMIIPVGLNLALQAARGRWLVRVDAHAVVPADYVERAVAHLRSGQWGGVGGRKDGVGHTPAGRAIAAVMASRFGVGNSTYHYGTRPQPVEHIPFGAYPVALARELGGWDERLRVNQDFEFDYRVRRAGHRLLFDPDMTIEWECRQRLVDLYRQYRRYGEGKVRVMALHPASARPRHLAAPALVASWVVAAGLVARRRPAAAAAIAAPYVLGVTLATRATAAQVDRPARPFVAPAFVAMHAGWGLGFWRGAARLAANLIRRSA